VLQALAAKGISIRVASPKLVMEEAPESYKNVTDVVDTCHMAGSSQKCIKRRPIAVIKGWRATSALSQLLLRSIVLATDLARKRTSLDEKKRKILRREWLLEFNQLVKFWVYRERNALNFFSDEPTFSRLTI